MMMPCRFNVIVALALSVGMATAQEEVVSENLATEPVEDSSAISTVTDSATYGTAEVVIDIGIINLVNRHMRIIDSLGMPGYRIQIFFGNGPGSKKNALGAKARFKKSHYKTNAYVKWDNPNWITRVGDYRTKLEAQRFYREILAQFPSAYIVKDNIELPDIE